MELESVSGYSSPAGLSVQVDDKPMGKHSQVSDFLPTIDTALHYYITDKPRLQMAKKLYQI